MTRLGGDYVEFLQIRNMVIYIKKFSIRLKKLDTAEERINELEYGCKEIT